MNFYNTHFLVILTVDCGEFHKGLRSEKIGQGIAVNFYNTWQWPFGVAIFAVAQWRIFLALIRY